MSSVDKRIVELRFNNSQFEKGVSTTLATLQKLKNGLEFGKSKKSLTDLEKTGKKFNLGGVTKAINLVNKRFSTLGIIGTTALQEITRSALRAGTKIASAITSPIIEGGKNRALNIEQAKFQFEGLGIDVEKAMDSALEAVQGTAYGLDEAAKVASQFGASGMVAGKEMTKSLRAVSGVAAMTGSNYDDIGRIFVQVAGQGRLMGDQLMQLSSRGINAAATLGKQLGKTEGEVREMVTDGEISFKTFYTAMDEAFGAHAKDANKVFTGALANMKAALARIGAEVAGPGLVQFRDLFNTLTPVIDNTKSALMPLIESINDFVKLASKAAQIKLKNIKTNDLNNIGYALDNLFHAFGNIFAAIGSYISPFTKAIKKMIPKDATGRLVNLTADFYDFTEKLALSKGTSKKITSILSSLFSIIGTGTTMVSNIVGMFTKWISKGLKPFNIEGKDVLDVIDKILKAFDKGFTSGVDSATKSFKKFGDILTPVKNGLSKVKDAIGDFISFVGSGLTTAGNGINDTFDTIISIGKTVWDFLKKVGEGIKKIFSGVSFTDVVDTGLLAGAVIAIQKLYSSFSKNTGSFLKTLSRSLEKISKSASGALDAVKKTLESYQKDIKATTILKIAAAVGILAASVYLLSQVKPTNLAGALGAVTALLAETVGSLAIIAKMKLSDKQILKASAAMLVISVAVGQLASALAKLNVFENPGQMLAAAGAITIVLGALTGAMAGLVAVLKKSKFKDSGTDLIKASAAMVVMANAVMKLAKAVALLGAIPTKELIQGGIAVGVLLTALVIFTKVAKGTDMKGLAAVIGATAVSILLLQKSVKKLGEMDQDTINNGLKRIAILLAGMVVTLNLFRGVKIEGAASTILAMAVALNLLIVPIIALGKIKLSTLVQGAAGAAGAIVALGLAMRAVPNNFGGAAGLSALAVALTLLIPQIVVLGSLPTDALLKGIGGMAAALVVLGTCVRIISPLTPALIGLAAAFTLFGAGVTMVGAGVSLLAIGLTTLAGSTGITTAAFMAMLGVIPVIALELASVLKVVAALAPSISASLGTIVASLINVLGAAGKAIVKNVIDILAQIAESIGDNADKFVESGVKILSAFFNGLEKVLPKILSFGINTIIKLIKTLTDKAPKLLDAGVQLLMAFLNGLQENSGKVINKFADLIVSVLKNIAKNVVKFVTAGAEIITNFLKGMKKTVPKIVELGMQLVTDILKSIAKNIKKMVTAGIDVVINFLDGVQKKLPDVIDKGFKLMIAFINGMADGIRNNTEAVLNAVGNMISAIFESLFKLIKKAGPKLLKAGKKLMENLPKAIVNIANTVKEKAWDLVKKLATAVIKKKDEIIKAGKDLILGLIKGIMDKVKAAEDAVKDLGNKVINGFKNVLGIHSPSKVAEEIGIYFVQGFEKGIENISKVIKNTEEPMHTSTTNVQKSLRNLGNTTEKALKKISKTMKNGSSVLDNYFNAFIKNSKALKRALANDPTAVVKEASKTIEKYAKALYKESEYYKEDTAAIKQHKKELKGLNAERKKAAKVVKEAEDAYDKNEKKRKSEETKLNKILKDKTSTKKEKSEAKKQLEEIDKERQKDKKKISEAKGYYEELGNAVKETNASIKEDQDAMAEHTSEIFKSMRDTVKDTLSSLVDISKVELFDFDSEKDSIKSGLQSISDMFSVSWIKESDLVEPIVNAISSINDIFNSSLLIGETDFLEPIRSSLSSMLDLFSTSFITVADVTDPIKSTIVSWTDAFGAAYTKVSDLFSEFSSEYEGTTDDILANMKSQVKGVKEWRENLELLSERGLSTDFLKTLEDLGVGSAGMIKRFTEMTDEELAEASDLFAQSSALAAQSFVDGFKTQNDQIEQMGKDMLVLAEKGFNEALLEELANKGSGAQEFISLYLAMTPEQVSQINEQYKRSLALQDTVTYDIFKSFNSTGIDAAQSFIDGFASKQEEVKKLGEDLLKLTNMGFNSSIIEDLSNKGSDARTYIDLFMTMTPEQISQLNSYYGDNLSIQNETAQQIADSYGLAGEDSVQAYIEGLKSQNDEVEKLGKDILELSKRGFDAAVLESLGSKGSGAQEFIDLYMKMSSEQIAALNEEYKRSLSVQDSVAKDILESYGKAGVNSAQSFVDGFKDASSEMVQMGKDILELSKRGFDAAILEQVAKQGEGAQEYIKLFMTMTDTQIKELNNHYKNNLSLQDSTTEQIMMSYGITGNTAAQAFINGLTSQNDNAEKLGKNMVELAKLGFDEGILEYLGSMGEGAEKLIEVFFTMTPDQIAATNEQFKRSLTIPDEVTDDIMASYAYAGSGAGEAYLNSLQNYVIADGKGTETALAISEEMTKELDRIYDRMDEAIKRRNGERAFRKIGENVINGMSTGVSSREKTLRDRLLSIATGLVRSTNDVLGIRSPSRVFKKIGKFTVEGFAIGISKTAKVATTAMSNLSDALIDNVENSSFSMNDYFNDQFDPTIKPILDLSSVKKGLNAIDAAFSKKQVMNLSADIESSKRQVDKIVSKDTNDKGSVTEVNFVQNNYSPKSLSQIDIYRQTKNQLSQLRTVT